MSATIREFEFRPRGTNRFGNAAFLVLWLCGWLVGELIALVALAWGLIALLTGNPPPGQQEPLELGPSLAIGGFLLVWLTLWTIGGVAAIRQLLQLLWAEDRIAVLPDGLLITHRLGPFVSHRRLARQEIHRIYLRPPAHVLMAQVGPNTVTLTALGTPPERTTAATHLQTALQLTDGGIIGADTLPDGWQEFRDFRGDLIIVPDLRTRRKQAWGVTVITGIAWTVLCLLIRGSLGNPNLWPLTLIVGAFAGWLVWLTWWLHRGRNEWRIDRGRIVHQRRVGWNVTEIGEARSLELTESVDSDGDYWYRLEAPLSDQPGKKTGRRVTLQQEMHDPAALRSLGHYLTKRAAIPFHDLIPTDAQRAADLAKLTDALAASGKFGRWVARRLRPSPRDTSR